MQEIFHAFVEFAVFIIILLGGVFISFAVYQIYQDYKKKKD